MITLITATFPALNFPKEVDYPTQEDWAAFSAAAELNYGILSGTWSDKSEEFKAQTNNLALEIQEIGENAIDAISLDGIEDFATYTGTGLVMVKDINRGGTFISKFVGEIDPHTGQLYAVNDITVYPKAGGGFWARTYSGSINVKWADAKGDGITHDSIAINKALALGGWIFFPKGEYIIDSILYPASNSIIFGEGVSSKLKLMDNFGSQIDMFTLANKSFIVFKNLHLDGNLEGQTFTFDNGQSAIVARTTQSHDVIIDTVNFTNFGKDGVYVGAGTYNLRVVNSTFDTMRRIGVTIVSGKNITVSNNIFQNGKDLIDFVSNTGVHFEPNNPLEYCYNLIVSNNIFKDMKAGVTLFNNQNGATKNILVTSNTFDNITNIAAIVSYAVPNIIVSSNTFTDCGNLSGANDDTSKGGAVNLRSSNNFIVSNNIFNKSKGGQSTIFVFSSGFGKITDNTFIECQKNSIYWNYLFGSDDAGVGGTGRIITGNNFVSGSLAAVGTYEAIKTGDYATHYSVSDIIENNQCRVSPLDSYGGFCTTYYLPVVKYNSVYNNGGFYYNCANAGQRFINYGTSTPLTGTHKQGDYILNTNPIASGFTGWICTTAGSPGTWKTYGAISA